MLPAQAGLVGHILVAQVKALLPGCAANGETIIKRNVNMKSIERLKQSTRKVSEVPIGLIRTNGGTQYRESINDLTMQDYLAAMKDSAEFPPIETVFDGAFYWVTDGFHRLAAYSRLGRPFMEVSYISGSLEDARLLALSANSTHGLQRSQLTKRTIGLAAITNPAFKDCSSYEIAKFCGLSEPFIRSLRDPEIKERQQLARDRSALKKMKLKVTNPIRTGQEDTESSHSSLNDEYAYDLSLGAVPDEDELKTSELSLEADIAIMHQLLEADEPLKLAHEEIRRLATINEQLERRLHGLMNERNAAIQQAKKEQKRCEKLLRELNAFKRPGANVRLNAEASARADMATSLRSDLTGPSSIFQSRKI